MYKCECVVHLLLLKHDTRCQVCFVGQWVGHSVLLSALRCGHHVSLHDVTAALWTVSLGSIFHLPDLLISQLEACTSESPFSLSPIPHPHQFYLRGFCVFVECVYVLGKIFK